MLAVVGVAVDRSTKHKVRFELIIFYSFRSYFLMGDFLFLLTFSPSPSELVAPDEVDAPALGTELSALMEEVATWVPFLGGRPMRLPEALMRGTLPGGLKEGEKNI